MGTDEMIKELNKIGNILGVTVSNIENSGLTEEQKAFISTYQPENVFIVYGTLAPNRPNYKVLEHIKGTWKEGIVKGKLEKKGWGAELGYYGFVPSIAESEDIQAFILFSDEMNANWPMLDEFEGEGYKRMLAQYELANGETGVGYIYGINEV